VGDIQTLNGVIPRNQGRIIGVSMLGLGNFPDQRITNLSVNGVTIFENISGAYWSRLNQKEPWIFPISLQPGSTFTMTNEITGTAPGANDEYLYVTFYFEN